MKLNHVHFQVRELEAAVDWFGRILEVQPGFRNERIATFSMGAMTIIIDAANADAPGTLGFESDDCDADFEAVLDRGAVAPRGSREQGMGRANRLLQGSGRLEMRDRGPARQQMSLRWPVRLLPLAEFGGAFLGRGLIRPNVS